MKFRNLFLLFIFTGFILSYMPSYGQDADNDCKNYCTDKEKFPDENYTSGRLRPDGGVGKCKDDEEVQDICCCVVGKETKLLGKIETGNGYTKNVKRS